MAHGTYDGSNGGRETDVSSFNCNHQHTGHENNVVADVRPLSPAESSELSDEEGAMIDPQDWFDLARSMYFDLVGENERLSAADAEM